MLLGTESYQKLRWEDSRAAFPGLLWNTSPEITTHKRGPMNKPVCGEISAFLCRIHTASTSEGSEMPCSCKIFWPLNPGFAQLLWLWNCFLVCVCFVFFIMLFNIPSLGELSPMNDKKIGNWFIGPRRWTKSSSGIFFTCSYWLASVRTLWLIFVVASKY